MDIKTYLLSYLFPQRLDIVRSRINGSIIIEYYQGQYRTSVDGYWQSGMYAELILKQLFSHLKNSSKIYKKILLLGLGCGSMIHVINQSFPGAQVTGVEIDHKMIEIGKRYFHLDEYLHLTIVIADASKYVKDAKENEFDMVISDIFVGCDSPSTVRTKRFIQQVSGILDPKGVFLCNFSQNENHKKETDSVIGIMRNVFSRVEDYNKYPNQLVLAYK